MRPIERFQFRQIVRTRPAPRLLALLLMAHLSAWIYGPWVAVAQSPPVSYQRYDVALNVQPDGVIAVTVTQLIEFDGAVTAAFFEIPRDFVSDIESIDVVQLPVDREGNVETDRATAPMSLDRTDNADTIFVEWTFPQTEPGEQRAFRLSYDAIGALWVYPDGDFITWDAVHAERGGVPVHESTVTVTLPSSVAMQGISYNASGPAFDATMQGQTITFTAKTPIADGTPFSIAVSMPHGSLDSLVQPWQKAVDAETLALTIDRVDVDLTVAEDGSLFVHEAMDVTVSSSVLYEGSRALSLLYRDGVHVQGVSQNGQNLVKSEEMCEGCFLVTQTRPASDWVRYSAADGQIIVDEDRAGDISIDWSHTALGTGETASIGLDYLVEGALRIDEESQSFAWDVLPGYGLPIAEAEITLHLPPGVAAADVVVEGALQSSEPAALDDETLRMTYLGGGEPQPRWQVALTLPPGATTATKPGWQLQFEQALFDQQAVEQTAARGQATRRVAGLLAIGLGGIGLILVWLRRGRRRDKEELHKNTV